LDPFDPDSAAAAVEHVSEARLRPVVTLLAQGHKDESIARRMGVSTRTVRRFISAAIDALHAQGRFRAGVHAERRGWVG
jgi:DNA-binding NarL/FixJ family response regulator